MRSILLPLVFFSLALSDVTYGQSAKSPIPEIQWQKCLGGSSADYGFDIIQTSDGGYAICGFVTSTDSDVVGHHGGGEDAWVAKLDASGNLQWAKCYGGSGPEEANSIAQTKDGGYILAVRTESNDSQVSGYHGIGDAWIVKLDDTGAIQRDSCYGGLNYDDPCSIIATSDGSYLFAGYTQSDTPPDLNEHHGEGDDAWVIKINTSGFTPGFERWFGGTKQDQANSVIQTTDGGYIFTGFTHSSDDDVVGYKGGTSADVWVVKLTPTGYIEWQKCLGGTADEWANSIIQTSDGGYAIAGITYSTDGDVTGNHGGGDEWVAKLSRTGDLEWQKCLGGSGKDLAWSIVQTPDGGYAVGGYTGSSDGDVSGSHGGQDVWLVELDGQGNLQWQKCMGGSAFDQALAMILTKDGGFALTGNTSSTDGDVHGIKGHTNAWVVKLSPVADIFPTPIASSNGLSLVALPNSNGTSVAISYNLSRLSDATLHVANITGLEIEEMHLGVNASGHHDVLLDCSRYVAGTYFVTLQASGNTCTVAVEIGR